VKKKKKISLLFINLLNIVLFVEFCFFVHFRPSISQNTLIRSSVISSGLHMAPLRRTSRAAKPTARAASNPTKKASAPKRKASTRKASTQQPEHPEPLAEEEEEEPPAEKDPHIPNFASDIDSLKANAAETQDAIDNIRGDIQQLGNSFESLDAKLDSIANALRTSVPGLSTGSTPTTGLNPPLSGTNPLSFIQQHLGWVSQTLVSNIVSCKLDPKELIQLLPEEERPSRKATARSNLQFDNQTGTFTAIDEPYTTFEKDFPSLGYLTYALSIYGTIRGLYDIDNLGFGPAIFLHIKRITRDSLIHNYEWRSIVSYVIAHFRKHQKSTNPIDWINTDTELFISHVRPSANNTPNANAPTIRSPAKQPTTQTRRLNDDICYNYNTQGKGCTWSQCVRKHLCLECKGPHPQYTCNKSKKPTVKIDLVKNEPTTQRA